MAEGLPIRHPSALLLSAIFLGLLHVYTLAYHDYSPIPVFKIVADALGLTTTAITYIWYFAVIAHVGESLLAFGVCVSRGYPLGNTLTWGVLVFFFGFGYLGRLVKGGKRREGARGTAAAKKD
eukprot:comp17611_c0_seq1/m.17297 comp17611_c0_seq1/g.17297  ORF comp17611_c0_seq1/g.17297 comp17611_c0_seq1/m.17297 type:complete len:123 (-) comp17611_c0_seq1:227-595(-)